MRRALLIGSQTYGLAGPDADVGLMQATLQLRAFESIVTLTGDDATRSGILAGFENLIGATGPGDAVVVYYSGHGGRVPRPDGEARRVAGSSTSFQFIVPTDIDASETDDFRGLLSEELTVLQQRLTDAFLDHGATPNVTMILDCCHSGYLARDDTLLPKAIELEPKMFRMMGIRTRAAGFDDEGGLATNPHAVRMVACQEEQSAFERASARGGTHGVLTDVLVGVLDELGEVPVSWAVVGDIVRRRVLSLVPEQRTAVEGPSARLLFSPETDRSPTAYPVADRGGSPVIEAADVLGISIGDVFDLRAAGAAPGSVRAVVATITGGTASLRPDGDLPVSAAHDALRATPVRIALGRRLVTIAVDGPVGERVAGLVESSARLTTADPAGTVFATVIDDGGLVVLDDAGARMRIAPEPADEAGCARVLELLETMTLARRLQELPSGRGSALLEAEVTVRFGTVDEGAFVEREPHGARLSVRDRVRLNVRNASEQQLYFWVFDVGVSGRTRMLTNGAPSGTTLGPRGTPDDDRQVWGAEGGPLSWPADVPRDAPSPAAAVRRESFVVIVADQRHDLSALDSPASSGERSDVRSSLDALVADVRFGVREDPPEPSPGDTAMRYRVEAIDFLLSPPG